MLVRMVRSTPVLSEASGRDSPYYSTAEKRNIWGRSHMELRWPTLAAWLLLISCWTAACQGRAIPDGGSRADDSIPQHWARMARRDLMEAKQAQSRVMNHRAKNAILFLGDGMGMPSVTAGRILKGQLRGKLGEEETLAFERFPHTGLAKTYNTDMQTPDSAGTATAYLCGVKAKSGTMGVDERVVFRNCSSQMEANFVYSFLSEAQEQGKSVGIVTTTRITHATPGAAYAHSVWRDWEDDTARNSDVPDATERPGCPDIAQQLVDNAINYTVLFGGGRANFLPEDKFTTDAGTGKARKGRRSDGVNLLDIWAERQRALGKRAVFLETPGELESVSADKYDAYLGLFAASHLGYSLDSKPGREPTLTDMTLKAIQILSRNAKGFALLVEGGRIDHGHHINMAKKALHELVVFDEAIEAAGKVTSPQDTLTVVTADHSHVFSIGGWARRGQPLFGKVDFTLNGVQNAKGETLAKDGMPYTSLFYGDGPSAVANGARANLTDTDTEAPNFTQQALVKFPSESHGAEDVPVYARGPGAHLFHSTHEQSYVAHVIKHALCVGEYAADMYCLGDDDKNSIG